MRRVLMRIPSQYSSRACDSPVRLDIDDEVLPARWDSHIRAVGGCLFHTQAWSEFRSLSSAQSLFFRWTDRRSGELIGLAVGTQRLLPGFRRARVGSYVLIESPPATARSGVDFLNPLFRWAATPGRSVIEVQLGSLDSRSQWAASDPPLPIRHYEFLFPPRDQADVLGAISRGTRSTIKRAQRLGVEVRTGCSFDDLLDFAQLGELTKRRLIKAKGLPPGGEPPEARAAALDVLMRRGVGRLYLACLGGDPVAGCFFGVWDGTAYYLQNGADDRARDCGAVHAVLHRAITDFMSEGFTRVNLGSVPGEARAESSLDHGLYNFKLRLGTEPVSCTGGTLVVRPTHARALAVARRQRDLLRSIRWRLDSIAQAKHPSPSQVV
jgi:Acetyltransferase (GNAT) domain